MANWPAGRNANLNPRAKRTRNAGSIICVMPMKKIDVATIQAARRG
jgi:hypothetical protein